MCINPYSVKQPNGEYALVPCGKCVECKKDRQNETAILCVREAEKRGTFEFVTLTYNNDTIPMYYVVGDVDEDSGELIYAGEPTRIPDPNLESEWRTSYFEAHDNCFESDVHYMEDEDVNFVVTPSLCRKDVQDWLKRARINYERHHGDKLDFGYICCGEYGPNTGRPHWHLGFFGLTHDQVLEMTKDWNDRYGYDVTSTVEQFNVKDKTKSPWEAVGKYVGKYIAKPKELESDAVLDGRVEKPRRQSSIGFGFNDRDLAAFNRYYLCYDMVGEYDPDRIGELKLTGEQFKQLAEEIIKRKRYNLNGKQYKLPRKISRAVFYRTISETQLDGTVKRKDRKTQIQAMVALVVRNHFNQNFADQFEALKMQYGDDIPYSAIREIVHSENITRQARARVTFKNMLEKTYKKSYF